MTRRIMSFALLALLVVAVFAAHQLASSSGAHAAGGNGCSGSGCDGLDPGLCLGDATTHAISNVTSTILVFLEYSPGCNASWAELSINGTPGVTAAWATIEDSDGTYYSLTLGKASRIPEDIVTEMVGPRTAQACGTVTIAGVLHNNCTGYH